MNPPQMSQGPYPYQYPYPQQQQQMPYPYPYPMLPPPPPRPAPTGKHVPTIWLVSMIALALGGIALALGGAVSLPLAPAAFGNAIYNSSLASDDGAWILTNSNQAQCQYENGALHATITNDLTLAPSCELKRPNLTDMRLSVRILPQTQLTNPNSTLQAVIFVHSTTSAFVAVRFATGGKYLVYSSESQLPIYIGFTNQWHDSGAASNTVVIQTQGAIYTLGMNGVTIYQGDFNGKAERAPASGSVGLGTLDSSNEAAYADFSLSTP